MQSECNRNILFMEMFSFNIEKDIKSSLDLDEKESAKRSLKTERGLLHYKNFLQLSDSDIEGKKILDLGSGPTHKFANEAEKNYKNTKVISFDYSFDNSNLEDSDDAIRFPSAELKRVSSSDNNVDKLRIEGMFTELPFKDESFDLVVSSAAMPLYLTKPDQIYMAFKEVIRVLKEGGKARLGPITYSDIVDSDFSKNIDETHRKHTREESEQLFGKILDKFKKEIQFDILAPIEKNSLSEYSRTISPSVLVITKRKPLWKIFNKNI